MVVLSLHQPLLPLHSCFLAIMLFLIAAATFPLFNQIENNLKTTLNSNKTK